MKSTHRLTFTDKFTMNKFVFAFFNKINEFPAWRDTCDCFTRGLNVYVDTQQYMCVENFILQQSRTMGFEVHKY